MVQASGKVGSTPTGTVRSVNRALEILHILSFNASSSGMSFSDLQAQSGLSKGTLHRLLKTLMLAGFVEQAAGSRVYYLGLEFLSLGERAANRLDIREVTRPSLDRLATATGDTVMLTIRSGLDAVCINRRVGAFPVRVLTQNIGTRRPLGIGSGSLALLAASADEDINSVLLRIQSQLVHYPNLSVEIIRQSIADTRERGYAFNPGHVLKGMYGVGVCIHLNESPVAALSIAANYGRMNMDRRLEIVNLLKQEAAKVSSDLSTR